MSHSLVAYLPMMKSKWDAAVKQARNGHFMFLRDYMDYHSDRFKDVSFMLLRGNRIVALLPAHVNGPELLSHQGLSFGGWIQLPRCLHVDLKAGFRLLGEEMKRLQIQRLVYTPSPYPYHVEACDDDLFLLKQSGASLAQVKLSSFIPTAQFPERKGEQRRRLRKAAETCPCVIEETANIELFWEHLCRFLAKRHQASPVHSAAEICLLKKRFPENIRFFVCRQGEEFCAGEVIFLSQNVLRFQYAFYFESTAQSYLSFRLRESICRNPDLRRPWIDFGTSMEPGTENLMIQLHQNKENFGTHSVLMQTWNWEP